jgi:spoIIIJ-associated protein
MREVERSAASVEEAIEAALDELGVSEQEARVEIVQEPQKGILGIGGQQAVVRVSVREAPLAPLEGPEVEEQADLAEDFLRGLLERMGLDAEVDSGYVDGTMYVDVFGAEDPDAMGLLIGRHGQTLDALQEIVRSAVQRATGDRCRVMVDVEDYRKRRRSQLAQRARSAAAKVRRSGRPERMEPMTSYERKIVHDAVAEVDGVESSSEGEDPDRRVVIRRRRGR